MVAPDAASADAAAVATTNLGPDPSPAGPSACCSYACTRGQANFLVCTLPVMPVDLSPGICTLLSRAFPMIMHMLHYLIRFHFQNTKFKDKIINIFKTATAEHCRVTPPLSLSWL